MPVFRPAPQTQQSSASLLQRKSSCACGGGCPRCRESGLKVSAPGDHEEQEADRAAEHVMRMTEPHGATSLAAPAEVGARGGAGEPLPASARAFFEPRFGHSFGDVRVHTDARAAGSARSLDALAYTTGKDVVFAEGQYAPETAAGRMLLAHELAHVVQQRGAGGAARVQRKVTPGCAENESSAITNAVAQAHTDLGTAIDLLSQRPLAPAVKNAMWLAFREDSVATADVVVPKLRILKANIKAADYTCINSAHPMYKPKCDTAEQTYGFVTSRAASEGEAEEFFGPIHLCMPRFAEFVEPQQVRAVVHEASHRFLSAEDLGYFTSSGDLSAPNCQETGQTGGDMPGERLSNADAYACLV
ncbi:MAG TPA: DUF4157 domain-containing protein, partial [Pyrinomonadaceae bacterium]|nr:DUF4157 domain-containing protein [Pyrinomonadaceae bacterium]